MKLTGDFLFAAPRQIVWHGLLDPGVLASVLPGCERLELIGPNEYEGQLKIKVGPVQGDFTGKVRLEDLQAPESYRMVVDGRGSQGFVKATAAIMLRAEGDATRIAYDSDAQVGGRIATVGQRLIESSARAIVKQSLDGLAAAMQARAEVARSVAASGGSAHEATAAAAAAAPSPDARPSTTAFAAGVAREVAKDLAPVIARRALVVVALLIIAYLIYRVLT